MSPNWLDTTKYECIMCHKSKSLRDGSRRPQGFMCYSCLELEAERRVYEERAKRRKIAEAHSPRNIMIAVLTELCPVEGWYQLKAIAHEFNLKMNLIDKPNTKHCSKVLKVLCFTKRARKRRGSYMHVWVDPNLIKGGDKA